MSQSKGSSSSSNGSSNSSGSRGHDIIEMLSAPTSGAAAADKTASAPREDLAFPEFGFTCQACTYEHRGLEASLLSCAVCDTIRPLQTKPKPGMPRSHADAALLSRKRGGGGGSPDDDNGESPLHGEKSNRKKARTSESSESSAGSLDPGRKGSTVCIHIDEPVTTDKQGAGAQAASSSPLALEATCRAASSSTDSLRRQCPLPLLNERLRGLLRGRGSFGTCSAAPFFGQDDEWSCGYQNTRTLLASVLVLRAKEEAAALLLPSTSPDSPSSLSPTSSISSTATAAASSHPLSLELPHSSSPPPVCVPAGWLRKCQGAVPSVLTLQEWIEAAWAEGFDPCGKKQLHNRLKRTRKWIGATEVFALLSWLGLKCKLVDFEHGSSALIAWLGAYFLENENGDDATNRSSQVNERGQALCTLKSVSNGEVAAGRTTKIMIVPKDII